MSENPKTPIQVLQPSSQNKENKENNDKEVAEKFESKDSSPKGIPKSKQPKTKPSDLDTISSKIEEQSKDIGQLKSDVAAGRALAVSTLTEVEQAHARLEEETKERKEAHELIKQRIRVLEAALKKPDPPKEAPANRDQDVQVQVGSASAACILCTSTSHQLARCPVFPTGASRAAEFGRRELCRRCARTKCDLQTCPSPFPICRLCEAAGIREDRSVRHMEAVCDESKRAKAAKRALNPPERRPKRTATPQHQGERKKTQAKSSHPEGTEMPAYLPMTAPQGRQQIVYFIPQGQQYPQGMPVPMAQPLVQQHPQQAQMQLQPQGQYGQYGYQQ